MEMNFFMEDVRRFVIENFLFGEARQLDEGTSFLESGIVDSTGILELVCFIESSYGITVEDEELVPENLDNLRNIDLYLRRKLGDAPGGSASKSGSPAPV
ncbi:MAG: acyl carrier protein [Nitrospiraceae bacterium]|nr:acyl carrier protein [Nitrospiraceae bacterium]